MTLTLTQKLQSIKATLTEVNQRIEKVLSADSVNIPNWGEIREDIAEVKFGVSAQLYAVRELLDTYSTDDAEFIDIGEHMVNTFARDELFEINNMLIEIEQSLN